MIFPSKPQSLEVYGVSAHTGFLPEPLPLQYLANQYYQPWESLVADLPCLISSRTLRKLIDTLPVLDTKHLRYEEEWRRAYVILSFLTHAYLWGDETPAQTLPPPIARPFIDVANHLGLPPTATYAGLNLWNFKPVKPGADLTNPDNVKSLHTFTGTLDEAWFYLISVSIEAQGAEIIQTSLECFRAVHLDCHQAVLRCLEKITKCISKTGIILDRMHERCDPAVFYHQIRPFLAGSKGMSSAGLPRGVFYNEGNGQGKWREYSGGSNAQSSLIQLLDIILGIEHCATGKSKQEATAPAVKSRHGYIEEMRNYMPGPHRKFLNHVLNIANIREYATNEASRPDIQQAYQAAVSSLTTFRDKHIHIVSRYIVAPSRKTRKVYMGKILNIATASTEVGQRDGAGRKELCGTGGTLLMPFLKQTRDETKQAGMLSQ